MKTATGYTVKPLLIEHANSGGQCDAALDIHHARISMTVGGFTSSDLRDLARELIKSAAQMDNIKCDADRLQAIWEAA